MERLYGDVTRLEAQVWILQKVSLDMPAWRHWMRPFADPHE